MLIFADIKQELQQLFAAQTDLELAVLVGSQVTGMTTINSDWDIAIRWLKNLEPLQILGKTETLRRLLAKHLQCSEDKIDLIDMTTAGLAMRALIAEEGIILKGESCLAWNYFLQRTWRELEMAYWDKIYAA